MQDSGTSQSYNGVDTDESGFRDTFENSFHGLLLDRSTNHKLSSTWSRSGTASPGKATDSIQQFSAWTRYGEPNRKRDADNTQLASGGSGWWKEQMLVDRSLRTMAGLTSMFALIMVIISIRYFPELLARRSANSTSVGSHTGQDCKSLETTNIVSYGC